MHTCTLPTPGRQAAAAPKAGAGNVQDCATRRPGGAEALHGPRLVRAVAGDCACAPARPAGPAGARGALLTCAQSCAREAAPAGWPRCRTCSSAAWGRCPGPAEGWRSCGRMQPGPAWQAAARRALPKGCCGLCCSRTRPGPGCGPGALRKTPKGAHGLRRRASLPAPHLHLCNGGVRRVADALPGHLLQRDHVARRLQASRMGNRGGDRGQGITLDTRMKSHQLGW